MTYRIRERTTNITKLAGQEKKLEQRKSRKAVEKTTKPRADSWKTLPKLTSLYLDGLRKKIQITKILR
jgi:hypothetical protein